jgi:hypothetical protein
LATALIESAGGEAAAVAVAIEVPHGAVVETLVERGLVAASPLRAARCVRRRGFSFGEGHEFSGGTGRRRLRYGRVYAVPRMSPWNFSSAQLQPQIIEDIETRDQTKKVASLADEGDQPAIEDWEQGVQ